VARPERDVGVTGIVLASASPRRRELLGLLGISFRVIVADVDEQPEPGERAEALAARLAASKAQHVAAQLGSERTGQNDSWAVGGGTEASGPSLVLAADTIVVLDGAILNKPRDELEARAMLGRLRGRAHRVLTGVALATQAGPVWSSLIETMVWMRPYGSDEVERYVASGRPLDKAGAYGIQDADFRPVERIDGCYTNVVGLPLCEVQRALSGNPAAEIVCQCERWALGSTSQRPT